MHVLHYVNKLKICSSYFLLLALRQFGNEFNEKKFDVNYFKAIKNEANFLALTEA